MGLVRSGVPVGLHLWPAGQIRRRPYADNPHTTPCSSVQSRGTWNPSRKHGSTESQKGTKP